ncbi:MAG: AAA family ATPase [Shewanella indica]|uniref:AAA family ATPase n=1 Tax=Shewanella indica TaxID=768528 RepID=UPI003C7375EE
MDLSQQFESYKEYVTTALSQYPVDQTKLNCIAVFKAMAELTYEADIEQADSQLAFISREMLQERVNERYPVSANVRRQEVNKYLSQRFRVKEDLEPDFIEFTLDGDEQVYSRVDEVEAGSKRTAYRICQFSQRSKLIEYLCRLDLTLYSLADAEMTLGGIIKAYLRTFTPYSANQNWYQSYHTFTHQICSVDELSEDQLEAHWLKTGNGVASIKNGITSKSDFQSAKPVLAQITHLMKQRSDLANYNQSLDLMQQAKDDQLLSKNYNAVLNRIAVSYNSEELTFPVDKKAMLNLVTFFNQVFGMEIVTKNKDWFELSSSLKSAIAPYLPADADPLKVNIIIWRINERQKVLSQRCEPSATPVKGADNENMGKESLMPYAVNQILYGPPGTGKTYHTIQAAVKAAEPTFGWENRAELKAKYDALVDAKRIRFVTFHQSFGYEDFVEGLVAETTEDKQVAYRIKDGVFKKICDDAAVSEMHADPAIETNGRVWKLSIEGAHQNATKTYCLENDLGAIGWGDTGDLSKDARNEYFKSQGTNNQNSLMYFCHEMAIGDLVLCIDSKSSVEAVGVVTGEYRYAEEGLPTRDDYCHQLPIKWLAKGFSVDFKSLNYNKQFSLPTCYPLSRLSVGDVLSHLQSQHIQVGETPAASVTAQKQNFVLVIDEINRGNISKIFGELITLIEDSKRGGAEEAISLTLPYSNKPFSVPDNLYIIGTMNTADRSLAMMDTALRRRFDFVEMMPNPSLLRGAAVKGIDLELLLKTLNERIEILYDREHTLGHAFLMPVRNLKDEGKEDDAFAKLVSVFQNKVVPLLQEYFFEDWQKIRLVLGDNQREAQLQFIDETTLDDGKLTALFGSANELNHYGDAPKKYQLKPFTDKVWTLEETYIGIYQTNQAKRELE